jgi:hypothetical protein
MNSVNRRVEPEREFLLPCRAARKAVLPLKTGFEISALVGPKPA